MDSLEYFYRRKQYRKNFIEIMSPYYQLNNFSFAFAQKVIFQKISLSIEQGRFYLLVGKNGAGKTTFLQMLAGLVSINKERFCWKGQTAWTRRDVQQAFSFHFTDTGFYKDLSLTENLVFIARLLGVKNYTSKVEKVLETVQLNSFSSFPYKYLSQGMKQRLKIACLLLRDADLYSLDEPLHALDQQGKNWLQKQVTEWKEQKKTILLCSHEFSDFLPSVDRVLFFANRKILSLTSEEFDEKYKKVY